VKCKRCGVCCNMFAVRLETGFVTTEEVEWYKARGIFYKDGWLVLKQRCANLLMVHGMAVCRLQHDGKPAICAEAGCSLEMPVFRDAAKFYRLVK